VGSMGAGVDHILADTQLPAHLRICRIVDPALTVSMSNYLIAVVLEQHKKLSTYREHQQKKVWAYTDKPEKEVQIGILGMGVLGSDVALKLKMLGFSVSGFSSSRKQLEGIQTFAGMEELPAFLQACNVLICLLPLTADTNGFLNSELFSQCRPGTYIINVARGQHLVEADLLKALDEGQLSGACLDVFSIEPLPQDHSFWTHPKITITPHIASITKPEAAIPQLAENYLRMQQHLPLRHQVERDKGY
jgi:glyoxylate/hydroxypyruvate reductase A